MLECVLIAICVALVLCPTSLDPAIRLKERNERQRGGVSKKSGLKPDEIPAILPARKQE